MDYKGIDISQWQGSIIWRQVKQSGIQFVVIRDGYGRSEDPKFREYVAGAMAAGVKVLGTYHFIYSLNAREIIQEADQAVETVAAAGLPKSSYIFCDFEYDTERYMREHGVVPTKDLCTEMTRAFCERVKKHGYRTGFYLNQDYANRMYSQLIKHEHNLWLADYEGTEAFACMIRQYSSSGIVAGIAGNVDMDIWHNTETKPAPTKVPHIEYALKTRNHGILPFVKDWKKAEKDNDSIVGIAIRATGGSVTYRVHVVGGGWLSRITGCDWNDFQNGYAGNDVDSIDAIQVYYKTDTSKTGGVYYAAEYQVRSFDKSTFYPSVVDTNWEQADGSKTAGTFRRPITEVRMKLIQL